MKKVLQTPLLRMCKLRPTSLKPCKLCRHLGGQIWVSCRFARIHTANRQPFCLGIVSSRDCISMVTVKATRELTTTITWFLSNVWFNVQNSGSAWGTRQNEVSREERVRIWTVRASKIIVASRELVVQHHSSLTILARQRRGWGLNRVSNANWESENDKS